MKLERIDALHLRDHHYLTPADDNCFYFGEYTTGAGIGTPLNSFIGNFKKELSKKGSIEWKYKEKAIDDISNLILLNNSILSLNYTWVPIPPSKVESDPEYDDRLWQVLDKLKVNKKDLDARKLILAKQSREASHNAKITGKKRPTVTDYLNIWDIDPSKTVPKPRGIIVFDDVITTGASFKAAQKILADQFPGIQIVGIFIGRRIFNMGH